MNKRLHLGVGLVVVGTASALIGLGPLVDEGTCSSGGPYVVAKECPDSYDWLFWVVFGGVIAAIAGLVVVLFAAGEAAVFACMGAAFVVSGIVSLVKARSLEGDGQLGLDIVGGLFVPIGIGALIIARYMHRAENPQPRRPTS